MEDTELDVGRIEWNRRRNKHLMDVHFGKIINYRDEDFYKNLFSTLNTFVPLLMEEKFVGYNNSTTYSFFGNYYNTYTYRVGDYTFDFCFQGYLSTVPNYGVIMKYKSEKIMKIVLSERSEYIFDSKSLYGLDMVAIQGERTLYHSTCNKSSVLDELLKYTKNHLKPLTTSFESILIYSYAQDVQDNIIPYEVISNLITKIRGISEA